VLVIGLDDDVVGPQPGLDLESDPVLAALSDVPSGHPVRCGLEVQAQEHPPERVDARDVFEHRAGPLLR
jgi:hypothetical protein